MLRILDRYILGNFVKILFISIFLFTVIFILVDLIDFADNLIEKHAQIGDIIIYYFLFIPYILTLISPVAVLMAGLFSMANMSKKMEIIAIRASGISLIRIMIPLIIFSLFFSMFMVAWNVFLVPGVEYKRYIHKRKNIYKKPLKKNYPTRGLIFRNNKNHYFYIYFYDPQRKIAYNILINKINNGFIKERIQAVKAHITDSSWIFYDYKKWIYNKDGAILNYDYQKALEDKNIKIQPEYFVHPMKKIINMNFFELKEYITLLKNGGQDYNKALTEFYMRFFFPLANFITIFIGAPLGIIFMRKRKTSINFSISLFVTFTYYATLRIFQSLGSNGVIKPIIAASAVNTIFFIGGIIYLFSMNK